MPYKLVHFMYNGILHVNTKINIIVMMKIKKKLSVTKYVHKMSQKPYNEFPEKLKRPIYLRDLVTLAENGRSVRVQ